MESSSCTATDTAGIYRRRCDVERNKAGGFRCEKLLSVRNPRHLGNPCHALQTHVQPTGRGLSTFKLLLDLFSYFIITYGKLMKHFIGPTTLDRTISSDR
jgi:hypothetical protein